MIRREGNVVLDVCNNMISFSMIGTDILAERKVDPTFYPVIYGADEGDDWTDPKVWEKANPSLGITVGVDKVKAACESAKQNPAEENSFRQLRLNQWVKQPLHCLIPDFSAAGFPCGLSSRDLL